MEPISSINSTPIAKPASLTPRVLAMANAEMKKLVQMASQSLASPTLGTKIDVRV